MVEKILGDGSFYPVIPNLCKCGCNETVWNGNEYIKGHNTRIEHPLKQHSVKTKKQISYSLVIMKQKIIFIPTLCECGCNETVWKRGNKYINGHNNVGKIFSNEYRDIMSKGMKGKTKGKKKKPQSESHKKKIGDGNKGKIVSDKTRKKISISNLGRSPWNLGLTKETDERLKCIGEKISDSLVGKFALELNPNWQGGLSFIPYCSKFNKELREQVRLRDSYICQKCGKIQNGRKHTVHHIHYDKPNCYPDLITLCQSCNAVVNFNRSYYEQLFMNMLNNREFLFWTRRREIL